MTPELSGGVSDLTPSVSLPWGVRTLASLRPGDAGGEEAEALAILVAAGLPMAEAWIVNLSGEERAGRLADALRGALDASPGTRRVRLRPLFPSASTADRFGGRPGILQTIDDVGDVPAVVGAFLSAIGSADVAAVLGAGLSTLPALVVCVGRGAVGRAATTDPRDGDPDRMRIWESAATAWIVDRRAARVLTEGEGLLDRRMATEVAGLADRAHLALGQPVELEWCLHDGRPAVAGVHALSIRFSFSTTPLRRVEPLGLGDSRVSPLAVDTLDMALRAPDDPRDEATVVRVYGSAYRRAQGGDPGARGGVSPVSVLSATRRAARGTLHALACASEAAAFETTLAARLPELDSVDLRSQSDDELIDGLRDRQRLAADAFALLDRLRLARAAVLGGIEATVGSVRGESLSALGVPVATRDRERAHAELTSLGLAVEEELGALDGPARLSRDLARRWNATRAEYAALRSVGIDVRPAAIGNDDLTFLEAIRRALGEDPRTINRARRAAEHRVLATARSRRAGPVREAVSRSLLVVMVRVARSRGRAADALASTLLRLRAEALEAGRRLAARSIVDGPEDALYLFAAEIGQALRGEPGAYGARVRLRREDDHRWARFRAPARIAARRATPRTRGP